MPVIINDFQIEVEAPPQSKARGAGGEAEEAQPAQPSKPRPEEITAVVRLSCERVERVRAD
ncbi:MAG TPA: hypothetical protein VF668_02025 [Pyrinomonadaceae bacterium]|jgi:hypothetical protein